MTRTIYDQFSKDCLEELLSLAGKVEIDLKVPSEVRDKELQQLPKENQFRDRILEIVANLIAILEVRREEQESLEPEEGEFLMQLSTIYTQRLEEATQKGIEQGIEIGEQRGEQRGIEIGEQRGIEIAQKRLAQNLLSQGMEVEQVAELTELSLEEVRKLMTSK